VATAAKIANHNLTVIAVGGDGDGYGEGGNHFINTARRNVDLTYLVHNNQIYGLTKGQASPTSDMGMVTKITPHGVIVPAFNPIAIAISAGASFVSRSFAGDVAHLTKIIKMAIQHRGFALVDILQPCVTFNHVNTYEWYKKRVYKLDEENGYDPTDKFVAFKKSLEWGDRIPIGVIYREERPTFEEQLPALKKGPLFEQKLDPLRFNTLLEEFM
jgi:2-oxoglutarate ferredoxin oxidoreductase subunit beta